MSIDFSAIAAAALAHSRSLVPSWLPAGRLRGHEFVCGGLDGAPGESLSVNLTTGLWADFAADARGGDLISLYAGIRRMSQADAARALSVSLGRPIEHRTATVVPIERKVEVKEWAAILPVPDDAPAPPAAHPNHGTPTHIARYLDRSGALLGLIYRCEPEGERKQIPTLTYCQNATGRRMWRWQSLPKPRSLYGAELLGRGGRVLVVEGEPKCEAARRMLGDAMTVVSWAGGCQAAGMADWAQLAGRDVVIWPDADTVGREAAARIVIQLRQHGAAARVVALPSGLPDGWDLADAEREGWDGAAVMRLIEQETKIEHDEPPPATSEGEYGANVVNLPRKGKSKQGAPGWQDDWHVSPSGVPLPNLFNAMLALRNHPKLMGLLRYDAMARTALLVGQVPGAPHDPAIPRALEDADVLSIQEELQRTGLRRMSKDTTYDAVQIRAKEDRFHPVHDYLNALVWDGETRVGGWLSRYLGVEGCPYSDTIGQMFLVAMVARQFEPGCQADYMMILEGPQGARKSTACRVLAAPWFSDSLPDIRHGGKDLSQHLKDKWLIEIGELSAMGKADTNVLKSFITRAKEEYRPSYGRLEVKEPRQCLFIGTTNETAYLNDATGGRRFWPVKVGVIDIDALTADRDQLFAEAVALYRAGAARHPDPAFEAEHIVPQQVARFEADPWHETISEWLRGGIPILDDRGIPICDQDGNPILTTPIERCTATQILRDVLNVPLERISVREQRRVGAILSNMGWVQKRTMTERAWLPPAINQ